MVGELGEVRTPQILWERIVLERETTEADHAVVIARIVDLLIGRCVHELLGVDRPLGLVERARDALAVAVLDRAEVLTRRELRAHD